MSLSNDNNYGGWNVSGNDIALEHQPEQIYNDNAKEEQKNSTQLSSKDVYIRKLALSINSLEAMYERNRKKRRRNTIFVVCIVTFIWNMITNSFYDLTDVIIAFLSSSILSLAYYGSSSLLLSFSHKRNTNDMITIEKLRTELAILRNQKENTYNLPLYHDAIDTMEDWL